jgi:pimeloyl-ACP methyl ester carboxylesterase
MGAAPTAAELVARCRADGELKLSARYWTGGLRLVVGSDVIGLTIADGSVSEGDPGQGPGVITISGAPETWEMLFRTVPPPYFNDISVATNAGLQRTADDLLWWQYVPAVQRIIELLREPGTAASPTVSEQGPLPRFDSPTGRYVHIELEGCDHRIYFEEAGTGIPLLMQHTAGSHGVQWRHLFECREITEHFRLIAYDLPFHGKSVPPVGKRWWKEQYKLTGEFLRAVPTTLAKALELDRPVFMGCSVGGLLALDLALRHSDEFRSVISLEGALKVSDGWERLTGFWHPQVSNDTKARMMEGLTSPTSPDPYRKETIQAYAAGWPQAFLGDLWYYMVEYDLTARAHEIDTAAVGVHILSGEYDYSGSPALGQAAHVAIPGSTWSVMNGVGHFPMSENPTAFLPHLLPVLDTIRTEGR